MKQYGIIGFPLSHSFSPAYFNEKFAAEKINAEYLSFPLESIGQLPDLLQQFPDVCGLNVTIPHKTAVIPYLDFISKDAENINAVNCIRIEDGKLYGHNTDHFGFSESLKPLLNKEISHALVLGTGGSSKAVCYALQQLNISYQLVSSGGKGDLSYSDLTMEILHQHLLIVNTTPLGMFPEIENCPDIPYPFLGEKHLLYDLIYNPEETLFLQNGKQQNARTNNGQQMLILQADKSWEIWNETISPAKLISLK